MTRSVQTDGPRRVDVYEPEPWPLTDGQKHAAALQAMLHGRDPDERAMFWHMLIETEKGET